MAKFNANCDICQQSKKYLISEIVERLNPNFGGGGSNFTPPPSWFSLNNSKTVKAITMEICSIQ